MTRSAIFCLTESRRAGAEEVQLLREVELLRPPRATWPRIKFGEVVSLNTDRTADPLAAGIERFVGLEHIEPEDLRIRRWGLVADGTTFTNRFRPGQVLFGKRRAYQRKVAVADFEGVCSSDIYVFESKDPDVLLPELLPFICQTEGFFQHAVGTSAGSLSPRTNWTQLAAYEFALPPLEEQRRIAEVLGCGCNVVEYYRLAFQSARIMLDAFREHVLTKDRTKSVRLGQLLERIEAGKSVVGINEPPNGTQYGVLKVSAIGADGFRPAESKTIVDQDEFLPQFVVAAGDLIVTRANTPDLVGMACLVETDFPNLMLSDKTLRLVPKAESSPLLLHQVLWTRDIRQQIKAAATGTGAAMKNISQEKIQNLAVSWPVDESTRARVTEQLIETQLRVHKVQERMSQAHSLHFSLINHILRGCA